MMRGFRTSSVFWNAVRFQSSLRYQAKPDAFCVNGFECAGNLVWVCSSYVLWV